MLILTGNSHGEVAGKMALYFCRILPPRFIIILYFTINENTVQYLQQVNPVFLLCVYDPSSYDVLLGMACPEDVPARWVIVSVFFTA